MKQAQINFSWFTYHNLRHYRRRQRPRTFSIDIFFKGWWTLFVIIPCFFELLTEKNKVGSLIGIVIGVLLLLGAQGVFSWEISGKLILAFIIIAAGLSILFRGTFGSHNNKEVLKP